MATDVEEYRLACRTFRDVYPNHEKEFARRLGVSRYRVWKARNIAVVASQAFDALESRGLPLTKANFKMIRDETPKPSLDRIPKKPEE